MQKSNSIIWTIYLARDSILAEKVQFDLAPLQVKQAETQKAVADGTVTARLPETYQCANGDRKRADAQVHEPGV